MVIRMTQAEAQGFWLKLKRRGVDFDREGDYWGSYAWGSYNGMPCVMHHESVEPGVVYVLVGCGNDRILESK